MNIKATPLRTANHDPIAKEAETEDKSPKGNIDARVDYLGMENELRPAQPFLPAVVESDSDVEKDDLKWDICPLLNRRQRRQIRALRRKHRKMFAGPEGKLSRVKPEYDMFIQVDGKKIRPKQPYRTTPRKRKLIKEAIDKLLSIGVIAPSKSPYASPVVIVIQHGKPRLCRPPRSK
jgi:hypothetical protein